jgi:hypothetical protein
MSIFTVVRRAAGRRAAGIAFDRRVGRAGRGRLGSALLAFGLVVGVVGGVESAAVVVAAPARAAVSAPPWWSGSCDAGNDPGSYPLGASYNGVQACGPLPGTGGQLVRFYSGAWGEYEWQCVELVMRYMYQVYGIAPYSANGNTVVSNYSGSTLVKVSNNGTALPSPGDIVSEAGTTGNPDGHTAVVTAIAVTGGTGTVTVMEQNATSNGTGTITVSGGTLGSNVTAWLHNPTTPPPPPSPPAAAGAISALVHTTRVDLSWGAASGATDYQVSRNGALLATVSATTYLDVEVSSGQDYTYSVVAQNAAGLASPVTLRVETDSDSADMAYLSTKNGPAVCGRAGDQTSQKLVCDVDTATGWTSSYSVPDDWGYATDRSWLVNADGTVSYCRRVGTGDQGLCDRFDGTTWTQSMSPPMDFGMCLVKSDSVIKLLLS